MGASKEFPITDHEYIPCGCGDPDCPYCAECHEQKCFHIPTQKPREPGTHAVNENLTYMEDMIFEHILGRALKPNEVAWHLNKDTLDNRNENLYLYKFDGGTQ